MSRSKNIAEYMAIDPVITGQDHSLVSFISPSDPHIDKLIWNVNNFIQSLDPTIESVLDKVCSGEFNDYVHDSLATLSSSISDILTNPLLKIDENDTNMGIISEIRSALDGIESTTRQVGDSVANGELVQKWKDGGLLNIRYSTTPEGLDDKYKMYVVEHYKEMDKNFSSSVDGKCSYMCFKPRGIFSTKEACAARARFLEARGLIEKSAYTSIAPRGYWCPFRLNEDKHSIDINEDMYPTLNRMVKCEKDRIVLKIHQHEERVQRARASNVHRPPPRQDDESNPRHDEHSNDDTIVSTDNTGSGAGGASGGNPDGGDDFDPATLDVEDSTARYPYLVIDGGAAEYCLMSIYFPKDLVRKRQLYYIDNFLRRCVCDRLSEIGGRLSAAYNTHLSNLGDLAEAVKVIDRFANDKTSKYNKLCVNVKDKIKRIYVDGQVLGSEILRNYMYDDDQVREKYSQYRDAHRKDLDSGFTAYRRGLIEQGLLVESDVYGIKIRGAYSDEADARADAERLKALQPYVSTACVDTFKWLEFDPIADKVGASEYGNPQLDALVHADSVNRTKAQRFSEQREAEDAAKRRREAAAVDARRGDRTNIRDRLRQQVAARKAEETMHITTSISDATQHP